MPDDVSKEIEAPGRFLNALSKVLQKVVPQANPYLDTRLDKVKWWVIEFNDDDIPFREVALDNESNPIAKLPWNDDYGYWTDNTLVKSDFYERFKIQEIDKQEFEKYWDSIS